MSSNAWEFPASESARESRSARALWAAAFTLVALTGCSAPTVAETTGDQTESLIRDVLDSNVIDGSRTGIAAALERGATRSGLAAQVDEQFKQGAISGSTACLQTGLIYGLSDDEIVVDCRAAYQTEIDQLQ